jgi:3-hydroxyacyl-CoA dehydrogenase
MFWADQLGLKTLRDRMLEFRRATGDDFWTPAPRLERLLAEGKGFTQS